jgi:hypothetical protein
VGREERIDHRGHEASRREAARQISAKFAAAGDSPHRLASGSKSTNIRMITDGLQEPTSGKLGMPARGIKLQSEGLAPPLRVCPRCLLDRFKRLPIQVACPSRKKVGEVG